MLQNAQYSAVNNLSSGLLTDFQATEITSKGSPSNDNCRIYGLSIGNRKGYEQIGSTIAAGNQIRDILWNKQPDSDNDVLICITNKKLYYLDSTDTWRAISFNTGQGFTVDAETNHVTWRGVTFFVNGTDELGYLLVAELNENITTATTDFDINTRFLKDFIPNAAGKITIGTDEIDFTGATYTASTGITNVTGVTNIATSHSIGDLCFIYIEPTTGLNFKPLYCDIWAEKLWVAGPAYPSTVFYSVTASSPEKIFDFSSLGSGSNAIGKEGDMTGLKSTKDALFFFKRDSVHYVAEIDLTASAPVPQIQPLNNSGGAISQKVIEIVEQDILYFTGKDIRRVGPEENFTELTANSISANRIESELSSLDEDQSSAAAIYNPNIREYEVFCKTDGATNNDISYTFDLNRQSFLRNINKAVAIATNFKDNVYIGSALDSEVYKDNSGYSDDDTALFSSYYTKEFDFGLPSIKKIFREIYVVGGISDITTLTVEVYVDGSFVKSIAIDSNDIVTESGQAIGFKTFGSETLGTTGTDDNLYLFRKKISHRDTGFKIQLRFTSDSIGSRWQVRNFEMGFLVKDRKASLFSAAT